MSRPVYQQERSTSPTRPVELDLGVYREIFTHSKEAIAIISPEGRYLEQNGAHFNLLHYTDDELKGATPAIHLGEGTFQTIAQQLATNGHYSGEVVSITREGEERNLELSAFAMRNSLGEPLCYVGIKRDITQRKREEQERLKLIQELTDALATVKTLSGLLPICASCKKIRDDNGYWQQVETYIQKHSNADFTHGICPDCIKRLYPEYSDALNATTSPNRRPF